MTIFSNTSVLLIIASIAGVLGWAIFYIHRQHRLIKMASLLAHIFLQAGSFESLLAFRCLVALMTGTGRRKLGNEILSIEIARDKAWMTRNKRKKHLVRLIRFDHLQALKYALQDRLKQVSPVFYQHVVSNDPGALQSCLGQTQGNDLMPTMPIIDVVAVAFERLGELKVFVQSWINQTESNWTLTVLHDGLNVEFTHVMEEFQKICPGKIMHRCTDERYNDFGHTLRQMGISQSMSDYILLTNADNYFIPRALEFINEKLFEENSDIDVLLFNMVHSHEWPGQSMLPSYSFFDTQLERGKVDVSSAIVKTGLAQKASFRDKKADGDATYFEDILALSGADRPLKVLKLPNILFVHN